MSDMYEGIMTGLREVLAYAKGEAVDMVIHHIPAPDVRAIRERMGMNQTEFARTFGISVGTLRNWEQGRRHPQGTARTLLKVMDKEPEAVKRALAASREDFKKRGIERPAAGPARPRTSRPAPDSSFPSRPRAPVDGDGGASYM